jgi:PKD repeat protein
LWNVDIEGDGFGGLQTVSSVNAESGVGESANSLDCDDENALINPDALDVAGSGIDANCDGYFLWYVDNDGDGFGGLETITSENEEPGTGTSDNDVDCDDNNAEAYPGAYEPHGSDIDYNCDGIIGGSCNGIELGEIVAHQEVVSLNELFVVEANFSGDIPVSVTFDWGDNTTTQGQVVGEQIIGEYEYTTSGLYEITLTLENNCGELFVQTYKYVVVIDPCAGKLRSSGFYSDFEYLGGYSFWNYSFSLFKLNAAYRNPQSNPSTKGNFYFYSSRYQSVFRSQSIDWLVINDEQIFVKGRGRINHEENCSFFISMYDSKSKDFWSQDAIRVVLINSEGEVVYDDQDGAPWTDKPLTGLFGNAINIKSNCNGNLKSNGEEAHTSVDDFGENTEMKVYPNPSKGKITIKLKNRIAPKVQVSVFNNTGQLVQLKEYNELDLIQLDLSNMSPGVYLIQVENGEYRNIEKIILNRQ